MDKQVKKKQPSNNSIKTKNKQILSVAKATHKLCSPCHFDFMTTLWLYMVAPIKWMWTECTEIYEFAEREKKKLENQFKDTQNQNTY